MTASKQNAVKEIRKKALDLHRKHGCCPPDEICHGPTEAEWAQATRKVLPPQKAATS